MRFRSTPESANALEPTWLAIIETFVSIGIYVGIAVYFETTKHIALAVVLAPLMLFRTVLSTELGLTWLVSYFSRPLQLAESLAPRWMFYLFASLLFATGPLAAWVLRVVSTIAGVLPHPIHALRVAPSNWFRQTLCTDLGCPPEVIAGANLDARAAPFRFHGHWLKARDAVTRHRNADASLAHRLIDLSLLILLGALVLTYLVLPLVYRMTFKATAIVYAPLVWVFQSTLAHHLPAKERLTRIKDGELEKVRRKWSSLVLTILAAKLGVLVGWLDPSYLAAKAKVLSTQIFAAFVVPESLPVWQLAAGVNGILTFALLWFVDAALPRLKHGTWSEGVISGTVSTVTLVRGLLSLYTVAAGFLIAWNQLNFREIFTS